MNKVLALALVASALSLAIALWTYLAHQVRMCDYRGGVAVVTPFNPVKIQCVQPLKEAP